MMAVRDKMMEVRMRPWVRSGTILGVVDFLQRNGYDPRAIVGSSVMKMAEAADAYRQVDLLTIMSIFRSVADATGRSDIGLELGQSLDLTQMGPFGHLFLNAPSVGAALADFVRSGPVFQSQAHFGMTRGKHRACIEYSSNHVEMPGWEIDSEITIAYVVGICNSLTGRRIIPDEIHLDHVPICSDREYFKHFRVHPRFSRKLNRVFFPLELLDEPVQEADHSLYVVLRRHLHDLGNDLPNQDNLVDVITNNIRRGLGTDTVTLEHIASEVGIEPRTLQRRLGEQGTSFNELFDQVRLDLSMYYLERTTLDMTEIALEIGFAGASAFSRAFKRWTGTAPDSYRRTGSA